MAIKQCIFGVCRRPYATIVSLENRTSTKKQTPDRTSETIEQLALFEPGVEKSSKGVADYLAAARAAQLQKRASLGDRGAQKALAALKEQLFPKKRT